MADALMGTAAKPGGRSAGPPAAVAPNFGLHSIASPWFRTISDPKGKGMPIRNFRLAIPRFPLPIPLFLLAIPGLESERAL
jgi:hypothetical protein